MKKILIVDGNNEDLAKVKNSVGKDYDVSNVSAFAVNNMALSTVITIANTVDSMDAYMSGHSLRVAVIAKDIAANLGWDENECQNTYFVALLHDLGMITVPDTVKCKPGRLDEAEYDVVKKHPAKGVEMLRDITVLENLREGVMHHHERWDGKGYPAQLSGNDIPAIARVIAVADAYDAMSSERVYRPSMSTDKIISELTRCRGTQFDPDIADVFVFMLKDGYTVDPRIEQTKEASERAAADGGLKSAFSFSSDTASAEEMDMLTGLFTRSYLNTRVGNKISKERSGALVLIDITGYESVGEKLGRNEADSLLRIFSDRLRSLFREEDVICRISDDRFAVFVSGESGKGVIEKKAGMITDIFARFDEFEKYRTTAGIDIGISMCMEDGVTFEELYGVAEQALTEAKETGTSTYRFREV